MKKYNNDYIIILNFSNENLVLTYYINSPKKY